MSPFYPYHAPACTCVDCTNLRLGKGSKAGFRTSVESEPPRIATGGNGKEEAILDKWYETDPITYLFEWSPEIKAKDLIKKLKKLYPSIWEDISKWKGT